MGLLIKLGFRNISRNPLRSALTITAVMLCAGTMVVFHVFFSGMTELLVDGVTKQRGHVRIIHPELSKNERLGRGYYFVSKLDKLIPLVEQTAGVKLVVPQIDTGGYIDHSFTPAEEKALLKAGKCAHDTPLPKEKAETKKGKKGLTFFKQTPSAGAGIDPDKEKQYTTLHKRMFKGRWLQSKGREVILGKRLAKRIHACVGSKLTIIGKTVDDSMSAIAVKVVGIFSSGNGMQDKTFLLNLKTAQYFMDLPNQASYVKVFAANHTMAAGLKTAVNSQKLPGKAYGQLWSEDSFWGQTLSLMDIFVYFFSGIFIFVGAIGLLNTLMMSVMERRKEVGIMMALGLTPGKIRNVFLFEGLVFGLAGAILGVIIGLLFCIPIVTTGMEFGGEAMSKMDFPMSTTIKGTITFGTIVLGFVVGLLTTLVGSILPAQRAAQMEPVEVLRQ